jgi:hypothetical protein
MKVDMQAKAPDRRPRWTRMLIGSAASIALAAAVATTFAADEGKHGTKTMKVAQAAPPATQPAKPAATPVASAPAKATKPQVMESPERHGKELMQSSAARAGLPDAPRTLHEYVEQEQEYFEFLKKNHPIFSVYQKEGRLKGKPNISDREEEFVEFGGGKKYAEVNNRQVAMTYRLGAESMLEFPNKYVGPQKCGECHPAQYEKWERSRHSKMLRFPNEVTEVKDLKSPVYPSSPASVLPPGITPDFVFAVIGTPRTKYGYLDPWIVRGTYHIEGGNLKDGTGTLVAGGNQFSRSWAQGLTPETAKKVAEWIPGFPTKMEDFGPQRSTQWGMNSYGAQYGGNMLFQPGSSYCEVCHSWKFNFKSKEEFYSALGDPKKLQEHTISKGVSCEECHGAGGHLVGASSRGAVPSNCERCHQRFSWNEQQAKDNPKKPFNPYFKSKLPSCGTEGGQSFNTSHRDAGMRCSTCHDPHEVTENDWRDPYTKPAMKKQCEDCHANQAAFFAKRDNHSGSTCASCHMPVMMSCENFAAIQFPDHAGFDTARTSHVWRIKVDPEKKTLNPPAGQKRDFKGGAWQMARDKDQKPYLDLQWTCGRTSWSDGHLIQNGGCHSPVLSQLPADYQFKDQKQIYEHVMNWQRPVTSGMDAANKSLKEARVVLGKSKAAVSTKAQAQLMINQAQDIVDAIGKDGSKGVHAPKYTADKVQEARTLADGARALLGAPVKVAAAK